MGYLRYYLGTAFMLMGVAGLALGGGWVWLGAATFPLLIALDLPFGRPDFSERNLRPGLADVPLYLHVVLMLALLGLAAWRIGLLGAQAQPPMAQIAGCALTVAWLGAVPGLPVMHELIHRREKLPQVLALVLSVTLIYPVRRLAHLRGHHVHFGMDRDTDTAKRGETIFGFAGRVMIAAAVDAFRSERERLAKEGRTLLSLRGDVMQALGLSLAGFAVFWALGGFWAVGTMAVAFLVSTLLTEGFNYFQHYGLVRVPGTRAGPRHVWNHLAPVNRAIAYEITNHTHHHMDPTVPFHRLKPDPQSPQMPSIVLCFLAGMIPPLFIRLIAMPRLRHWDLSFATPEERALAAKANAEAGWPDWLSGTAGAAGAAENRPSAPALS